jgi:uncharacterized protein YjbI with pentapeptide repeats
MEWGVIAAISVGVIVVVAVWWWVPQWQTNRPRFRIRDPKARADVEDNLRKSIGQLLGGAAVLLGAGLAFYQTQRTLKESDAQSQRALAASAEQLQRNLDASRALLISQQIAQGFDELSSDKLILRLGGIYSLEGVMNNSPQYHQPVLEALCAFVRNGASDQTNKTKPALDIQAALTVIGRRQAGGGTVNLTGADLTNADLTNANLSDAVFYYAQMHDAVLEDANLTGASLFEADLGGADLNGAELSGTTLIKANLEGATMVETNLKDAFLGGANLTNALLYGAILVGAGLSGANLTGADLTNADLTNADLGGANLTNAHLNGVHLNGVDLSRAFLRGAYYDNTTKFPPEFSPGKRGMVSDNN